MAPRSARLAAVFIVALGLMAGAALPGSAAASTSSKIAPYVMQHTAGGRSASFIVVMRQQANLSHADALRTKDAKGEWVFHTLTDLANRTQAPVKALLRSMGVSFTSHYAVNALTVTADRSVVTALAARSDISQIVGDPWLRSTLLPRVKAIPAGHTGPDTVEWNVAKINAPAVWATGDTGQGIVLGSIDTGQQWDHPALKPHYRGWNGTTADHNYNWYDETNPANRVPTDPYGHGTHTAGTMVGDDGHGNQIGVAPGAKWFSCRSMDSTGFGSADTYVGCLEFMLAPWDLDGNNPDPTKAPVAVSNSWFCSITQEGCSVSTLLQPVKALRAAGIVPIFSAGNDGPGCSTVGIQGPPAQYQQSFSVGATDSNDLIAFFSSRGPVTIGSRTLIKPEISAPGVAVRSSYPPNTYATLDGTSMASPHIAGTIALLLESRPLLIGNVAAIEKRIEKTAFHINSSACSSSGTWPNNLYGYGRVDAAAAVGVGS